MPRLLVVLAATAVLIASPAAAIPSEVHLTLGDDPASSVVVGWISTEATGVVEYGPFRDGLPEDGAASAQRRPSTARPHGGRWIHHAVLEGLEPGRTYRYRSGSAWRPWG